MIPMRSSLSLAFIVIFGLRSACHRQPRCCSIKIMTSGALTGDEPDWMDRTPDGHGGSDFEDECLPVESVTPLKKPRICLEDCFTQAPESSKGSTTSTKRTYDSDFTQITLAECFGIPSPTQSAEASAAGSVPVEGFLDLEEAKGWHPNRIWAVVWDNILTHSIHKANKRLGDKQTDWVRYLNDLVGHPQKKTNETGDCRRRCRAKDVFTRMLSKFTGHSWRKVRTAANMMWRRASQEDQYRWRYLGCAEKDDPDIGHKMQRLDSTAPRIARCLDKTLATVTNDTATVRVFEACAGIMLTYNVGIGLKSPEVLAMVQEKATPTQFIEHFQGSVLHTQAFETFWSFLLELGEKLRFKTIGASMELSENAECPGRVHLHAYLGTSVKGGTGAMRSIVRADIVENDLVYMDVKPFTRPTKPRKNHPKTVFDAVVNGLYYVIGKKTTSILRKATLWHVQDGRECVGAGSDDPTYIQTGHRNPSLSHKPAETVVMLFGSFIAEIDAPVHYTNCWILARTLSRPL